MKPAAFCYHRATDVEHALDLLTELAPAGGRILAGGQSLVPLMALRLAQPAHLIDINRVAFGTIRAEDGFLCVPASARHGDFAAAQGELGRMLQVVAGHIAHLPIRSRGTFCGSLAHADPSAEWPLVFATLGGEAVVRSVAGERRIEGRQDCRRLAAQRHGCNRLADRRRVLEAVARAGRDHDYPLPRRIGADAFVLDIMTTALADDELLTEVHLAMPAPAVRLGFHEVSRRAGDYAVAMAFVAVEIDRGTVVQARIGVGGAERRARRIAAAEAALLGATWTEAVIGHAAAAAADAIDPMEDRQVSPALRRGLVRTAVTRALRSAAA